MPVQTSYTTEHGNAVAGAIAESQLTNSVSRIAEGIVQFGRLVITGTDREKQAAIPLTSGGITNRTIGVAQRVQDRVANAADILQYEDGKDMTIVDFGVVWVEVDQAVAAGAAAFVRFAGGNEGKFRTDADVANAVALPGAFFLTSTAAAGLAKVRLRIS